MIVILIALGAIQVALQVAAAWALKRGLIVTKMSACPHATILGVHLPKGREVPMGVKVHEWTHVLTGWVYLVTFMRSFGWVLFWHHGWWQAILMALAINWALTYIGETIADLAGMVVVGPFTYLRQVEDETARVGGQVLAAVIWYPPWRIIPAIRGRRRYINTLAEKVRELGFTREELKGLTGKAVMALIEKFDIN